MTKTKYSLPWIDATIKLLMKRRQELYLRARKSNDPDVKNHYKRFRAHVQKVEREIPIGDTFPIFSRLRTTPQILIQIKVEKLRSFERLFLAMPRGCLQFVIVIFPDDTQLLFLVICQIIKERRIWDHIT